MRLGPRTLLNGKTLSFLRLASRRAPTIPEGVLRRLDDGFDRDAVDFPAEVAEAIALGKGYLLGLQHRDEGYWVGELEADVTLNSEYIFLLQFLGISRPEKVRRMANHILARQLPGGAWNICEGGEPNLSATIEAYFALKLAGHDADEEPLRRAREYILSEGGIIKARVLTKIYLSYFGEFEWKGIPHLPIELIFMPNGMYFNIYEFACWARAYTVPMLIINALRPTRTIPDSARLDELWVRPREEEDFSLDRDLKPISWKNLFAQADKILRVLEKNPIKLSRGASLRRAERWILEHQDENGAWGGIFPAIVNCLMALQCLGYSLDHPILEKGLEALDSWHVEDGGVVRQQPCDSPIWDTAWSMLALAESNGPEAREARARAGKFLLDRQIRRPGDWAVKESDLEPGGWAFQLHNDFYPDIDDSAVVLMALADGDLLDESAAKETYLRGLNWLLGMQNDDGGWGAFEKNVDNPIYDHVLYNDCKNMLDPSTPDVTGRVVELLGRIGFNPEHDAARRGIAYLGKAQEPDGSWFGRWGVNYIYGTWSVLSALGAIGLEPENDMVRRGAEWLASRQNDDGGWGETPTSYDDREHAGRGPSTPSQTAWAILGLLAAGRHRSEIVERGVQYLLDGQKPDGSWEEIEWTGTGFPGAFYLRYHYYRLYFPLLALSRYGKLLERS